MPSAAEGGGRRPAFRGAPQAGILDTRKKRLPSRGRTTEGSPPGARDIAPRPCIRLDRLDPDHEAAMRFGGEAPGRRAHSHLGMQAMQILGSPPPRTVVNALPQERGRMPKL